MGGKCSRCTGSWRRRYPNLTMSRVYTMTLGSLHKHNHAHSSYKYKYAVSYVYTGAEGPAKGGLMDSW